MNVESENGGGRFRTVDRERARVEERTAEDVEMWAQRNGAEVAETVDAWVARRGREWGPREVGRVEEEWV